MGRELKRVPLDFDAPLNEIWKGYINPHFKPCPEVATGKCHNGLSCAGAWLDAISRFIAVIGQEATQNTPGMMNHFKRTGRIYPHPYLREWSQAPRIHNARRADLVSLDEELAGLIKKMAGGCDLGPMAGSSAGWEIRRTLLRSAGLDDEWGICKVCNGEGLDPATKEAYEGWKEEEPPEGEGFQLWETTSEGSPISPVFPSLDALCEWAEVHATTFGNFRATKDEWMKMLEGGLVSHTEGNMTFI